MLLWIGMSNKQSSIIESLAQRLARSKLSISVQLALVTSLESMRTAADTEAPSMPGCWRPKNKRDVLRERPDYGHP